MQSTRVARVLDGWRGAAAGDKTGRGARDRALSRFIADFADEIDEVEINPFAVLEEGKGCLALDCVIVPQKEKETGKGL